MMKEGYLGYLHTKKKKEVINASMKSNKNNNTTYSKKNVAKCKMLLLKKCT